MDLQHQMPPVRALLLFSLLGTVLLLGFLAFALPLGNCDLASKAGDESQVACTFFLADQQEFSVEPPAFGDSVLSTDGHYSIKRITDNQNTPEQKLRHHYSRRQAWNSDESKIVVSNVVLEAGKLNVIKKGLPVSSAMNWSNNRPDTIFGIKYAEVTRNELISWNVVTGDIDHYYQFAGFDRCNFGFGEGNLSNNDEKIVLACRVLSQDTWKLISFDLVARSIIAELDADPDLNWASFTQSGRYIVVEINSINNPVRRLIRYDENFENEVELTTTVEHGDLAVSVDGADLYVMTGTQALNIVNIETTNSRKVLLSVSRLRPGNGHVSCRNIKQPGWCYISTTGSGMLAAVFLGDGFLSILSSGYVPWEAHKSSYEAYDVEAQASVSPTGSQMIYTTDWGGDAASNDYIISRVLPD